jgi:large repetitive protein
MTTNAGRIRRFSVAALAACLALAGQALPAVAVGPLSATLVESYDNSLADWQVASGPGTFTSVASPKSQGTAAMKIDYDFNGGTQLVLAPKRTTSAVELPGLPRRVSIDVNGDTSWNVVYLQLRDATGEIFHYRLGNVSFSGWQTMSVEPGHVAPTTTLSGNADGVLDLPIQLFRVILDRNPGGLKTVSSIVVDNVMYDYEAWSPLRVDTQIFVPSAAQATTLRVGPTEAGTVAVTLKDEASRVRSFSGAAGGGGAQLAWAWNGKADNNSLMTGSVRARLTITRAAGSWVYGVPYLAGLAARYEPTIPGSISGINSRLTAINTVDRAEAERQAGLMESAWFRKARESFEWNRVEPTRGWFDWAKFDQAVEVARAHHVDILGRLEFSASWASSAPGSASAAARPFYAPASNADFAAYATAVVHRYKDRVKVWEIWNEENSATFWKPAPSASAYAALLKAAYTAIKAEDPTATVLIGGTVGFDKGFMDGVVAAGAWGSFDALTIHTYVAVRPESSMMATWLENAKAYVDTKGTKPIWISEFGWSTYTGSGASYIGVTEARQAEYTARGYLLAARMGVRGIFAYELIEHGTSTTSILDNYGLIETGGRPKPAYAALRRISEALDGATSAGIASPNAATRVMAASLDSLAGWSAAPLGGGSASIVPTTSRHSGAGAMQLNYSFTSTSSGVELKRNLALPGTPTMVSVWAYGDASANPVYIKLGDATGETFQGYVGALQKGWQRMILYGDGADANWTHSGGDNDGAFDYPLTLKSIFVFRAGIGKLSGTVYFDDLQVESGPRARGVVLSRRGGDNQALYTLASPFTGSVPVSGTSGWLIDGWTSTPLTVTAGKVSVALGALPVNVLSAAALAPSTITPNGDGSADFASMSWIAGDMTRYTFQVMSNGGALLRNVTVDGYVDAGLRTVTWDGRLNGSPAAPGSYKLRVAIIGPDARVSYLITVVTVQ